MEPASAHRCSGTALLLISGFRGWVRAPDFWSPPVTQAQLTLPGVPQPWKQVPPGLSWPALPLWAETGMTNTRISSQGERSTQQQAHPALETPQLVLTALYGRGMNPEKLEACEQDNSVVKT